jgi:hypothetical protein
MEGDSGVVVGTMLLARISGDPLARPKVKMGERTTAT